METNINPSAIGIVLILMAATSLFTMLSINKINYIVHGDLYNYYLQFSYKWAMPYWIFSGIVFGLSWINIALSIIVTLYIFRKSRTPIVSKNIPQVNMLEMERQPKEEKKQRRLGEFFELEKSEIIEPIEEPSETSSEDEVEQPKKGLVEEQQEEYVGYQEAIEETESSEETGKTHIPTDDE